MLKAKDEKTMQQCVHHHARNSVGSTLDTTASQHTFVQAVLQLETTCNYKQVPS